ncbi:hypothetical protein NUW58_g3326 [Xylaria curta]|uniref:Uncharacterized protein n=1 Tax=Xylaria curta TaxID=42375 RepID=A0ACC1PE66_9PEZI|nr:hypothetical protein NUW58_g3326 [Xylaria curta]
MAQGQVLMLGAGFVTRPTLDILSDAGIKVTVACRTLKSAQELSKGVKNAHPISLDVNDDKALDAEVAKNDLVISLIPYTFHATVIKSAIRQKKHVVTTSYVSPAMLELDQQCKDAGITVMNEIGLDPGIDHLYAIKTISEVHEAGGKILSFLSYCGGLPAPEDSGNPLGYKFSWSSRGVLLALRNAASYYQGGKVVNVAGPALMAEAKPYPIYPGFAFVAYNIPEAETIIRGTLRYGGFPEFIKLLVDLGFLSDDENNALKEPISWNEATQKIIGASGNSEQDLISAITTKASFKDNQQSEQLLAGLRWIGLTGIDKVTQFSSEKIIPKGNPLDTLCATLEKKMQFEEGERDLVMLQHKFVIENKDGSRETRTSSLCEYGAPVGSGGYSAMAKWAQSIVPIRTSEEISNFPCVAVQQVLSGVISEKGVLAPMSPKINNPLIKELKEKYGPPDYRSLDDSQSTTETVTPSTTECSDYESPHPGDVNSMQENSPDQVNENEGSQDTYGPFNIQFSPYYTPEYTELLDPNAKPLQLKRLHLLLKRESAQMIRKSNAYNELRLTARAKAAPACSELRHSIDAEFPFFARGWTFSRPEVGVRGECYIYCHPPLLIYSAANIENGEEEDYHQTLKSKYRALRLLVEEGGKTANVTTQYERAGRGCTGLLCSDSLA